MCSGCNYVDSAIMKCMRDIVIVRSQRHRSELIADLSLKDKETCDETALVYTDAYNDLATFTPTIDFTLTSSTKRCLN